MASVPATIVLAASALETPRERNATVTDFFDPGDPAGVKRNIFSSPVPRESVAASLGSATEGTTAFEDIVGDPKRWADRSEEHTSELQSLMRISYAVFCLKKQTNRRHSNQPYTVKQHSRQPSRHKPRAQP